MRSRAASRGRRLRFGETITTGSSVRRLLRPSARVVALSAVIFTLDQYAYQRVGSELVGQALLDWTDHVLTTMFIVWAARPWFRARWLVPAIAASVLIDADHIPGKLGWNILTAGTPRPYTHSLATIAMLLLLSAPHWRARDVMFGGAIGVASHLWRDLAEPHGAGVSLLWPLTDRLVTTPASLYTGSVAVLVAVGLWRAAGRSPRPTGSDHSRPAVPTSKRRRGRPQPGTHART